MALVAEVDAATRDIWKKLFLTLWTRKSPLVTKLMKAAESKGKKIQGGRTIKVPFEYQGPTTNFKGYVGAGEFTTSTYSGISEMSDTWVHLQDNVSMAEMDSLENQGEGQIVDRWNRKQEALLKQTQINIAKLVWGALEVNTVTAADLGLNSIDTIYTTGTTIHGVATADLVGFHPVDAAVSLWNPQEDTATEEPSDTVISAFITDLEDGDPDMAPNAGYCGKALWSALRTLYRGQQRFVDTQMLKAGFNRQFSIDTVPIFLDIFCPGSGDGTADNHLVFTNDKLGISIMKNDDFVQVSHKSPMETRALVKQLFYSLQVWVEDRFHLGRFTKFNSAL